MAARRSILLLLLMASSIQAAPATQRATTAPATQKSRSPVASMFADLSHPLPTRREQAQYRLMGLKRADLPELHRIALANMPLDRQRLAVVQDVVRHIYLSEEKYEAEEGAFLGISMVSSFTDVPVHAVTIERRMPGFAGYRAFQNQDVILDIMDKPQPQPMEREAFIDAVRSFEPGTTVVFKVLRRGQIIRIPVKLDRRPSTRVAINIAAAEQQVQELETRRQQLADEHWQKMFADLTMREKTDASAGK